MATNGSGLISDVFIESFTTGVNNPVYTTEGYVNATIRNYLNTNSTVNIIIGNGVSILNTVTGSNLTTVTVGLSADLGDLDDVNLTGLTSNKYLLYNGTCWVPGPGASISDLSLTDMTDVQGSMSQNSYLFSSNGTSAYFTEDRNVSIDNLKYYSSGDGIFIDKTTSYPYKATFSTSFEKFTESFSDSSSDYYIYVQSDGTTRRIRKDNIRANQFNSFETDVVEVMGSNLYAQNVITGHASGLSVVGTTFFLNLDGYLTGAGGILPISQGGTDGSTSESARANLGLCYNYQPTNYPYDIMAYNSPEFRNTMIGESIRLVGGLSGVSINSGGTLYSDTNTNWITTPEGEQIFISIATSGGGVITSATLTDPVDGFPYIYNDFDAVVVGPPGSGASVKIFANTSYINFGVSNGSDGTGFRYNEDIVEVKNRTGAAWEIVNYRFGVSELADVSAPSYPYTDGDILIFNGTCFIPTQVSGDISISASGNASFTAGGLCLSQIYFGAVTPTTGDFQNITGTTGNIQDQLDDKLYLGSLASDRSLLVLNNPTLPGTCASTISYDTDPPQGTRPQIPVVEVAQGVCFRNVYHSFGGTSAYVSSDIPNLSLGMLYDTTEIATPLRLPDFMSLTIAPTGGIQMGPGNNQIQLEIENLNDYSLDPIDYEDYVAIGPSQSSYLRPNQKLHIKDLIKVPIYETPSSSVPDSLSETPGSLVFFTSLGGTSYLGIATGNGSSWYGVSGFNMIY